MARTLRDVLLTATLVATASLAWTTRAQSLTTYNTTLDQGRVSYLPSGEVVVSMEAQGDLRGLLTLKFAVGAGGSVTGGDWALVSTFVEDLNEDGSVDHDVEIHEDGEPHHHAERIRIVDKGTLGGRIAGGSIGTGLDGGVALSNVQLDLMSGTLTFESVTGGSGTFDGDLGLTGAQGNLRLTF